MKKVLATVLALGMTTLAFTACGDEPGTTTTVSQIPVVRTTSAEIVHIMIVVKNTSNIPQSP